MSMNNLQDLYLDQLQDLYSACDQSRPVTAELARIATDPELKAALEAGAEGIERGKDILAELCQRHNVAADGEHCKGMEGLVTEARKHALEADIADDDTRDAAIITQYQRLTHYAIAGYGCVAAFANRLGLQGDAAALGDCLENTRGGDVHMSRIAQGGVNRAAAQA
ncbi:YciE/YciF ferroxidase family protein [Paracoccus sp. NSM]|uniref:YciE/YciF ferroxidase family protein n=1 Tax=Paracoccus sp. NSM TaxID=3457784 RepID=UPI0040357710